MYRAYSYVDPHTHTHTPTRTHTHTHTHVHVGHIFVWSDSNNKYCSFGFLSLPRWVFLGVFFSIKWFFFLSHFSEISQMRWPIDHIFYYIQIIRSGFGRRKTLGDKIGVTVTIFSTLNWKWIFIYYVICEYSPSCFDLLSQNVLSLSNDHR